MTQTRCGCSTWSAQATATLAASYLAAGFVHGVLNSDNINITGESFDYGPWRFTPEWDPDFTAAYFDHYGLYAFGRQPEAIHWDLAQLAGCLSLVADAPATVGHAWRAGATASKQALTDAALPTAWRRAATDRRLPPLCSRRSPRAKRPIDRVFFDWRGGARSRARSSILHRHSARWPRRWRVAPAIGRTHIGRDPASLLDAYRRGRGHLVGDCRARRLAAVRGQGYSDPANGRSDGAGCSKLTRLNETSAAVGWHARLHNPATGEDRLVRRDRRCGGRGRRRARRAGPPGPPIRSPTGSRRCGASPTSCASARPSSPS